MRKPTNISKKAVAVILLTGTMVLGTGMTAFASNSKPTVPDGNYDDLFESRGNIVYEQSGSTVKFCRSDLDYLQSQIVALANELPDTQKNEFFSKKY